MNKHFAFVVALLLPLAGWCQPDLVTGKTVRATQRFVLGSDSLESVTKVLSGSSTHKQIGTAKAMWDAIAAVTFTLHTDATLSGAGTTGSPLKIAQQSAISGQVLKWNGTTWQPAADQGITGNQTINLSGDVTGTGTTAIATTVVRLQTRAVASTAPTNGQVLQYSTLSSQWLPATLSSGSLSDFAEAVQDVAGALISATGGITATYNDGGATLVIGSQSLTGDLSGTLPSGTVTGLQGRPVNSTAPTSGQGLVWNGSAWAPASLLGSAITSLNGLTASTQNFALGTSGTDLSWSSATSTHTLNVPTASASNRGVLSAADWATFAAKVGGSGASGRIAYWSGPTALTGSASLAYNGTALTLSATGYADATELIKIVDGSTNVFSVMPRPSFSITEIMIGTPGATANNSVRIWGAIQGAVLNRMDFNVANSFFQAAYYSGNLLMTRTGDATSSSVQFPSSNYGFQYSVWNGSGPESRSFNWQAEPISLGVARLGLRREVLGGAISYALSVRSDNGAVSINTTANAAQMHIQGTGTTSGTYGLIVTNSSGNTTTATIAARDDGQVGIGTNAPARILHVAGNARITGSAGTPTAILGRDGNGDLANLTLSNLTITGGALSANNLYNADGTLTGARTVTMGSNALKFVTNTSTSAAYAGLSVQTYSNGSQTNPYLTGVDQLNDPRFQVLGAGVDNTLWSINGLLALGAGSATLTWKTDGTLLFPTVTPGSPAAGTVWVNTSNALLWREGSDTRTVSSDEGDFRGTGAVTTTSATYTPTGGEYSIKFNASSNNQAVTLGAGLAEGHVYIFDTDNNGTNTVTFNADSGYALSVSGSSSTTQSSFTAAAHTVYLVVRRSTTITIK